MNFAVLGCGKIAHRFIAGLKYSEKASLYVVASTNEKRAESYAKEYGVKFSVGYDEVLKDPNVDAVYVATYNKNHMELIEKALRNGKHVLCEKPMVMTIAELDRLFTLAKEMNCFLMEAQKAVFMPVLQQVKSWLDEIGTPVMATLGYMGNGHHDETHWVRDPYYGGAMKDVGVYPLSAIHYLFGEVYTSVHRDFVSDNNGCDILGKVTFRNPDLIVTALASFVMDGLRGLEINGPDGTIVCPNFWKATSAILKKGSEETVVTFDHDSEFAYYINHAVECIERGLIESPVMSQAASAFCIEYMQAC